MIPKVIHYCWFGRNPLPELAKKCINSWKDNCPDYKIIEWNEDTFDITAAPLYVRQAYEAKKYAFVTDYVRLWAMTNQGGIYMDTDVEVRKPLDEYLSNEAFSGFENPTQIPTGIMACRKDFPLFIELLREYDTIPFVKEDGTYDITTNVVRITNTCKKYGFVPNGEMQTVSGFALYPQHVFCPEHKKISDMKYMKDNATIHWFAGSWKSAEAVKRENSLLWKTVIVPMSKLSKKYDNRWIKAMKKAIWEPFINGKG